MSPAVPINQLRSSPQTPWPEIDTERTEHRTQPRGVRAAGGAAVPEYRAVEFKGQVRRLPALFDGPRKDPEQFLVVQRGDSPPGRSLHGRAAVVIPVAGRGSAAPPEAIRCKVLLLKVALSLSRRRRCVAAATPTNTTAATVAAAAAATAAAAAFFATPASSAAIPASCTTTTHLTTTHRTTTRVPRKHPHKLP